MAFAHKEGVHSDKEIELAVKDIEDVYKQVKSSGYNPTPPPGMTGIFGSVGSGKTLLAVLFAMEWYRRGLDVYYTSTTGLRFGIPLSSDVQELYTFAQGINNAILIVDELQSYINKYSQNAMSAVMFTESLASLRKNGVHVIYTAQDSHQASVPIRKNTTSACFPRITPAYRKNKRGARKPRYRRIPGAHDFCKLLVQELSGPNALSFTDPPNHLMMFKGLPPPRPTLRRWRPPYDRMVQASKLYNTMEQLDFAARIAVNAESLREHVGGKKRALQGGVEIGSVPSRGGRGEAMTKAIDDLASLFDNPETFAGL